MKKRNTLILALIALLFACCMSSIVTASADSSVALVTHSSNSARKGDVIEVTVTLSGSPLARSMALVPIYDTDQLEFVSGEWLIFGALLSDWSTTDKNGVILYSSEKDLNGPIAKYTFRVKDSDFWDDIVVSSRVIIKNLNDDLNVIVHSGTVNLICDHIWGDKVYTRNSTCVEKGYTYHLCDICGEQQKLTEIAKIQHDASDWIVNKEPTGTEPGEKHIECTRCGEILEVESIPSLQKNVTVSLALLLGTTIGGFVFLEVITILMCWLLFRKKYKT